MTFYDYRYAMVSCEPQIAQIWLMKASYHYKHMSIRIEWAKEGYSYDAVIVAKTLCTSEVPHIVDTLRAHSDWYDGKCPIWRVGPGFRDVDDHAKRFAENIADEELDYSIYPEMTEQDFKNAIWLNNVLSYFEDD